MKFYNSGQFLLILGIIIVIFLGYDGYRYVFTLKALEEAKNNLVLNESKVKELETELAGSKKDYMTAMEAFVAEQNRNNLFEEQIKSIQGAVGILEKLKNTDEELLQKYSKVYFLSENYVPSSLSGIDSKYVYDNKEETLQIYTKVQPYLYRVIDNASSTGGVSLEVISAYRSFGEQSSLKLVYKITYGSGANKFSADQGYSEHQLGTTIDLTTPATGESFSKFESTTAYKWLTENAYKYGFILSYPKENTYYQFEPWHWRYVGAALATYLHDTNQYFYNLTQREIDPYLVSIFD